MLLEWLDKPHEARGVHLGRTGGGWLTVGYPRLAADARAFAASLNRAGAEHGDVITLLLGEPRQFLTAFWATLWAGLVPSPLATDRSFRDSRRYSAHLANVLAVAQPRLVVADTSTQAIARDAAASAGIRAALVDAPVVDSTDHHATDQYADLGTTRATKRIARGDGDLAMLQFTSGSSGGPKAVRVSWGGLNANIAALLTWVGWGPDDAFASWLPLHHDMGLVGAMMSPIVGQGDLYLLTPAQFLRDPLRWLACFDSGATMSTAPSFGYEYTARRLAAHQLAGLDLSGWRVAILGAERIDSAALARFTDLTRPFGFDEHALMGAYGLAESTLAVTGSPRGRGTPLVRINHASTVTGGSVQVLERGTLGRTHDSGAGWLAGCGRCLDGVDVDITDESGCPVPEGVIGEIRVRGSSLARGYLGADGTVVDFDSAGLRTQDAGFMFDGDLYVLGRLADSIKVRGVTVYAEDVEAEIGRLAGLSPSAVCVLLGVIDGADHLVLLVERTQDLLDWLDPAVTRLRAIATAHVSLTVLYGSRGSIERTSSGKPRRRVLWSRIASGTLDGWQWAYGTMPRPGPAPVAAPAANEPRDRVETNQSTPSEEGAP